MKHLGLGQRDWEDEESKQRSPVVWEEMIEAELNLASLCFLTLLKKQPLQGEDNRGLCGWILSPWSGPFRARRVWWWGRISSLTWSVVLARNWVASASVQYSMLVPSMDRMWSPTCRAPHLWGGEDDGAPSSLGYDFHVLILKTSYSFHLLKGKRKCLNVIGNTTCQILTILGMKRNVKPCRKYRKTQGKVFPCPL